MQDIHISTPLAYTIMTLIYSCKQPRSSCHILSTKIDSLFLQQRSGYASGIREEKQLHLLLEALITKQGN